MDRFRIVLGLGNPGPRYRGTRHNIGFEVVERLADRRNEGFRVADWRRQALKAEVDTGSGKLVLGKPRTFMNRSGQAASMLCRQYEVPPEELLVVYDDADLALGRMRFRRGGSTGGHNGILSLVEELEQKPFTRLKLGVRGAGREGRDLADYVLDRFERDEKVTVEALVNAAADAIEFAVEEGLERAMGRFNRYDATAETVDPDQIPE